MKEGETMIKANFNAYNNYVTDSLYQWDINQELVIRGLNLSVAPEIHFSNANMDRAIVRQSTLDKGVVTVQIPNSMLQSALTIKAYVGVYKGSTFTVIETIEIPVIAKNRPSDYVIEKLDDEVYSFDRLENEIANMVTVKTFNSTVDSLMDTVNYNDTKLSKQITNIVTHNNDTEGNTELIDIRVDHDGNTHTSAGNAVRYYTGKHSSEIENINLDLEKSRYPTLLRKEGDTEYHSSYLSTGKYQYDHYVSIDGQIKEMIGYNLCASDPIFVNKGDVIKGKIVNARGEPQNHYGCMYDLNGNLVASFQSICESSIDFEIVIPEKVVYIRVTLIKDVASNYLRIVGKTSKWIKKICFLGDSITYGYGVETDQRFTNLLATALNCEVVNMGVSGTLLTTNKFPDTAMCKRVADVPTDCDILFVFGGTNDYWSKMASLGTIIDANDAELRGAVSNIIRYIGNQTNIKQLVFITPFHQKWEGEYGASKDFGYGTETDFVNAIKDVCANYAIDVIDLFNEHGISMNPSYDNHGNKYLFDGMHPNVLGHKRLASIFEKWIRNHYLDY